MMFECDPVLLQDWLGRSARRLPEKEAIICGGEHWTYRRLDCCSDNLAKLFVDLGVRRQDRVVICTGNSAETVVSLYGTLKAGGIFVILDSHVKPHRLRLVLEDSGARFLIARRNQAAVVEETVAGLGGPLNVIWLGGGGHRRNCPDVPSIIWETILSESSRGGGPNTILRNACPRMVDLDLAALIYTSGTTGQPKGVMCTHQNMVSAARSIIGYLGNREDDILLNVLPLSFSYGLYQVLTSCMFGGTVVLEPSFLYPHVAMTRIAEETVTGLPLVPSMAAMILSMESVGKYDLHTLRYVTSAGAALPPASLHRLRRLAPHAEIFSMYGLTECARVSYLSGAELDCHPTSVGRPMPNCEVRIVDDAGKDVAKEETGELIVRGSNVTQGYWGDPELTARTYRPGDCVASPWLYSGDYFRRDAEGLLYFLGRKDDMIKTRGQRVSPGEVETVIAEMEEVADVAAVGVPDDILGQAIKVLVVSGTGELDERAILTHCVRRLESFMVPKYVEFVAALPRTAHGKIDKRQLQYAGVAG